MFVMLIISLVGFSIKNEIGDPVRDMVGERVTPAEREEIRDKLGLNDPFFAQYVRFAKNAVQGNLGLSFFHKKPALAVIAAKAPATLELVFGAALIIIFISLPIGVYSAIYPKSAFLPDSPWPFPPWGYPFPFFSPPSFSSTFFRLN
jgi:peptide/nickel transport system permease protein